MAHLPRLHATFLSVADAGCATTAGRPGTSERGFISRIAGSWEQLRGCSAIGSVGGPGSFEMIASLASATSAGW